MIANVDANMAKIRHLEGCKQLEIPEADSGKSRVWLHGVLMGNWAENKLKFERTNQKHESVMKTDFVKFCGPTVDPHHRRQNKIHDEEDVPLNVLFHHHGDAHLRNRITWYDEEINRRERDEKEKFPDLRRWQLSNRHWLPEKSDHPMQGESTNWGLHASLKKIWAKETDRLLSGTYRSIYQCSYERRPPPEYYSITRYATPSARSMTYNKTDLINWDTSYKLSHQPEVINTERINPGLCEPKFRPAILYN